MIGGIELHIRSEKLCEKLGCRKYVYGEALLVRSNFVVHACEVNAVYVWPIPPVLQHSVVKAINDTIKRERDYE
jgi:hypothetical protein